MTGRAGRPEAGPGSVDELVGRLGEAAAGPVTAFVRPAALDAGTLAGQRLLARDRSRRAANPVTANGLVRCGACGRHVFAVDLAAGAGCPFCGAAASRRLAPRPAGRPRLDAAALPPRARALTEALTALAPCGPVAAGPVNAGFTGDLAEVVRVQRPEDLADPHPLLAVWELTLACDLGCGHCGSRAGRARPGELSVAEALDVVRQLDEVGVRELTIIGGEAYLYPGWLDIVREATRRGIVVGMQSGAFGLTEDRIQAAADAGLVAIGVSIDGLSATHDAQRGRRGSWRAAVDACGRIARSGLRLSVNSQINRLSAPELPALAGLLADQGAQAWQVQLTVAMGNAADRPELLLQPYDLAEIFPLLAWLVDARLAPGGVQLVPGNSIGYFGPYEEVLRYGGAWGSHWGGCTAGTFALGLEADGKVKGCPSLASDDFTGGNVRDRSIAEIVREAPELTALGRRTRADLWGRCGDCYYADVCKGGCTWTTHSLTGRPGNNPYCIHRVLELEAAGLRERVVRRQAAPGRPFDRGLFDIVEEPLPDATGPPAVIGIPLAEVLALDAASPGVWARADLIERIRRR